MKTLKNYTQFINESKSEDDVYDFIRNKVIDFALHFGFEEGERVYEEGEPAGYDGGDLILWNDNKKPTEKDWDKFWEYVKSVTHLYNDVIDDEWNGKENVKKIFYDELDGKIKDMFKEEYMKKVNSPKETKNSEKLKGDDLYAHILNVYVSNEEESDDMDNYSDEFEYYDNIIYHAVEEYISQEEPDKEDDDDYKDEITDGLKDYWQPI